MIQEGNQENIITTGGMSFRNTPIELLIGDNSHTINNAEIIFMGIEQQQQQHYLEVQASLEAYPQHYAQEQIQQQQQLAYYHQYDNINSTVNSIVDAPVPCDYDSVVDYNNKAKEDDAKRKVKSEKLNYSEASTICDDDNNDGTQILNSQEVYADLQGLNSDNLMIMSQQSAVEELTKEFNHKPTVGDDLKPNLNVLPTFETHDYGGYKFKLDLSVKTQRNTKCNWIYSEDLNKVYIRMNDIFSMAVVYTPKIPKTALRLRALLCFGKEVSEPVLRCQNHISKDPESNKKKIHSLLRCENPNTQYRGADKGKSINDRYSVLVPLNMDAKPGLDNTIKQTIALKFTCQNSCIGRKETSLIFILEGMNGEIHSQCVLDVKICSCPKRDKSIDERNYNTKDKVDNKRKMDDDLYPRKAKLPRQCRALSENIKAETSTSDLEEELTSSDEHNQKRFEVQRTPGGGYRLVMELYDKDVALHTIEAASQKVAMNMVLNSNVMPYINDNFRSLRRLHKKCQKQ